jgi:hypothetical protein
MNIFETEKLQSKILAAGSALTAVFLLSGSVTDPVNVTKFVILSVVALAALGASTTSDVFYRLRANLLLMIPAAIFLVAVIVASIFSTSPITQNLYGAYGRNTGTITYICLLVIIICTSTLRENDSFSSILKALFFAGIVNLVYCFWVLVFGDFIGWSNPSGKILGTFGNQDFVSAFLGIFASVVFAYLISPQKSKASRWISMLIIVVSIWEIATSRAIQGLVVAAVGIAAGLYFLVRSRFSPLIRYTYALIVTVLGIAAVLGTLQVGPLTKILYKNSVSLRGQYWLAAWNSGSTHPTHGVGMDAFGDWYRRSRDAHALVVPGVNTTVNTAHNVFLDMFAFGGWPLFISYIAIVLVSSISIIKMVRRSKNYEFIQVALITAWLGYQIQSVISINQIGLAIWGWLLGGAVIAYEKSTRLEVVNPSLQSKAKNRKKNVPVKYFLYSVLFGVVGLIIALPPFTADAKWRSAQIARSLPATEASMKASYFNPQNSTKYLINIQTLEASSLFDLSHTYALQAVRWNPDAFELWKVFYLIKNSTPEEKALALQNMKRLDPLNPDVTSIK